MARPIHVPGTAERELRSLGLSTGHISTSREVQGVFREPEGAVVLCESCMAVNVVRMLREMDRQ